MLILKIGGGESLNLPGIVADLTTLQEKFVIVHGANALRDSLGEALGRTKRVVTSVSGYSSVFSDDAAIELLMMAYAGVRNKRLVELCQQHGINAVGLSGLDGKVIQGRRNTGIKVKEGSKTLLLKDLSGKPKAINTDLLWLLLENGYVPVLCVPIIDENNTAINSENDDIVAVLQPALKADKVIHLIEAPGFLADKEDASSLIKNMSKAELIEREAAVSGRIKRKLLAIKNLFEGGATEVIISDGRIENPIQAALNGEGTVIR